MDDELFSRLREHWSDDQIVQILGIDLEYEYDDDYEYCEPDGDESLWY